MDSPSKDPLKPNGKIIGTKTPSQSKIRSVGYIVAELTVVFIASLAIAATPFLLYEWLILISLAAIVAIIVLIVQNVRRKRVGMAYGAAERRIGMSLLGSLILVLVVATFFLQPLYGLYYERYVITPWIPNPTAQMSAYPTDITLGQSTTITWTSTNANKCVVVDNNANNYISHSATSGSATLTPTAPGQADYFMTCYGPDLGDPLTQKFQDAHVLVSVAQSVSSSSSTIPQAQVTTPTQQQFSSSSRFVIIGKKSPGAQNRGSPFITIISPAREQSGPSSTLTFTYSLSGNFTTPSATYFVTLKNKPNQLLGNQNCPSCWYLNVLFRGNAFPDPITITVPNSWLYNTAYVELDYADSQGRPIASATSQAFDLSGRAP